MLKVKIGTGGIFFKERNHFTCHSWKDPVLTLWLKIFFHRLDLSNILFWPIIRRQNPRAGKGPRRSSSPAPCSIQETLNPELLQWDRHPLNCLNENAINNKPRSFATGFPYCLPRFLSSPTGPSWITDSAFHPSAAKKFHHFKYLDYKDTML